MTLRAKTMFTVSLTLIGLLVALFFAVRPVVLGGFGYIEQQDMSDMTLVVQRQLQHRFTHFGREFIGFAMEDDLASAMRQGRPAPFEQVFAPKTLKRLNIGWVAAVDPSGKVLFSRGVDASTGNPIPLPPDLIGHLRPSDTLLKFNPGDPPRSGLLAVPDGALLVAALPLQSSDAKGLSGTLILARVFTPKDPLLDSVSTNARSVDMQTLGNLPLPQDFEAARSTVTPSKPVFVRIYNEQTIAGFSEIKDLYDQPVAMIQVTTPRAIFRQADTTLRFFGCVMAIAILFFVALSMMPLEQLVLSRVDRLSREVDEVRESGDPARRVKAPGNDELSLLGQNINATLDALQKAAGRLSRSEEMYREMAQTALSAGDAYFILQPGEKTLLWHGDIDFYLGYSPGGFKRTEDAWLEHIHARDRQRVARAYAKALALNEPFEVECRVIRCDGEVRHWANRGKPIGGGEGEGAVRLVCVCTDITEKKESEEALRESEQRLQRVVETAADAIIITDRDGAIIFANDAAAETFGLTRDEIEQRRIDDPLWSLASLDGSPLDPAQLPYNTVRANGAAVYELEHTLERPDGRRIVVSVNAAPLLDARGMFSGVVSSYTDVTARRAMQDRLTYQAFHDPLTGLANRSLLRDRLQHALTRRDRSEGDIALLFIDLDNFKYINDSLGHAVGDELLSTVADRLRQSLRAGDTAARFGGDEFVVLMENVEGQRYSIQVAERLLEALQEPFIIEGREVFITPSIGIVHSTGPGDQADVLLRHADAAMYEAKRRGKARYEVFQSRMSTSAIARLEIENDLRRAMQRSEFMLYYQPKFHLPTGKIYGFEALVRWKHPEHGLISPGEFVPIAEETGLIVPMGFWILREACRRAHEWNSDLLQGRAPTWPTSFHETNGNGTSNGLHNGNGHYTAAPTNGLPTERFLGAPRQELTAPAPPPWLSISVNVSARQLAHPEFLANVADIIKESQLSPDRLILEITESVIVEQTGATLETLNALKSLGVRLAIDDFGTGYSSLAYLRAFPFDFLKIDRQFVAKLHEEGGNSVIVASMINLAHALNLTVIAEGAEHAEEVAKLRALDCDFAQGYYFGRPLPQDEVEALLLQSKN